MAFLLLGKGGIGRELRTRLYYSGVLPVLFVFSPPYPPMLCFSERIWIWMAFLELCQLMAPWTSRACHWRLSKPRSCQKDLAPTWKGPSVAKGHSALASKRIADMMEQYWTNSQNKDFSIVFLKHCCSPSEFTRIPTCCSYDIKIMENKHFTYLFCIYNISR